MKRLTQVKCIGLTVSALAIAGCTTDRGGATYYATTTSPYAGSSVARTTSGGAVLSETDSNESISRRRVDISDTGPGTPRGDATGADPSETSSQGAGSRALVGETSTRQGYVTTGETSVRVVEPRAGSASSYASTTPGASPPPARSGETVIPLYEEQLRVGKREVDAGTITIRKHVETERVNEPVELRRETVTIDRQPASGGEVRGNLAENRGPASQAFQEGEITIQLRREEPVVEKQMVPAGQIVARTQVQTQTTNIQSEVRRENVSVDRGNAQNVEITGNLAESGAGGSADTQSSVTGAGSSQAITDFSTLRNSEDASAFSGRQVQLNDVRVRAVVDPHLVALGDMDGRPVYARLQQPIEGLKEGDKIDVTGTVKEPEEAVGGAQLQGDAAHVFGAQPFYVEVERASKE